MDQVISATLGSCRLHQHRPGLPARELVHPIGRPWTNMVIGIQCMATDVQSECARTRAGQGDRETASKPRRAGIKRRCTFLKKSHTELPPTCDPTPGYLPKGLEAGTHTLHNWLFPTPGDGNNQMSINGRTDEGKVASPFGRALFGHQTE